MPQLGEVGQGPNTSTGFTLLLYNSLSFSALSTCFFISSVFPHISYQTYFRDPFSSLVCTTIIFILMDFTENDTMLCNCIFLLKFYSEQCNLFCVDFLVCSSCGEKVGRRQIVRCWDAFWVPVSQTLNTRNWVNGKFSVSSHYVICNRLMYDYRKTKWHDYQQVEKKEAFIKYYSF